MDTRYLRADARKRRKSLGLTLIAAAEQIGCSKSNLSRWERMEIPVPRRHWAAIEDVLGLSAPEVWRGPLKDSRRGQSRAGVRR